MNNEINTKRPLWQKLSLWVAFLTPVIFVGALALTIFWSRAGIKLDQDFVYSWSPSYALGYRYNLVDGKLTKLDLTKEDNYDRTTPGKNRLFRFSAQSFSAREITEEEAMQLKLSDRLYSRDGYTVGQATRSGDVLGMFGGYYGDISVIKDGKSKPITLPEQNDFANYSTFSFIGWVE